MCEVLGGASGASPRRLTACLQGGSGVRTIGHGANEIPQRCSVSILSLLVYSLTINHIMV